MYLLIYEISGKTDLHGLRMRLVYALRKGNATQLMRSTWLIPSIHPELQEVLDECIDHGYSVLLSEWKPHSLSKISRNRDLPLSQQLFGIVIHSPEVTDRGITTEVLHRLEQNGIQYIAILGGVMGRLAILDAALEDKVFINHPYKPSEAIDYLIKRNVDCILLLNQGITAESGIAFGRQVIHRSKLHQDFQIPIIQLDRLKDPDAFVICWQHSHPTVLKWIQEQFSITPTTPPPLEESIITDGESFRRQLRAVQLHDKILVNGVVVGVVTAERVEIIAYANKITAIQGGLIDSHGLDKLGAVDLKNARITTLKTLRRTESPTKRKIPPPKKKRSVALLTWRAEDVYPQAEKIDCLVSIGDDTTFVSTEILSRFSHPIIGIIDGDADGILYEESSLAQLAEIAPPHSLFIQVAPESDDIVGSLIERNIFNGHRKLTYTNFEALKRKIQAVSKDYQKEMIEIS